MEVSQRRLVLSTALLFALPFVMNPTAFAATAINLRHQSISTVNSFAAANPNGIQFKEISRNMGLKKTLHVRMQETYAGYDVWGADAVAHIPNGGKTVKSIANVMAAANQGSMNGIVYDNLSADLQNTNTALFTNDQAQRAIQASVAAYQGKVGAKSAVSEEQSTMIVYVDKANKAHWAYKTSFIAAPVKANDRMTKPTTIIDATTFEVYAQWDDIKNLDTVAVDGGGFGGNVKMGRMAYDGLRMHYGKLSITRDPKTKICTLVNDEVVVKDYNTNSPMKFGCVTQNKAHSNVYWDGSFDAVNGGFSPGNDAFFGGQVIKRMYNEWYNVPVLTTKNGSPMKLSMVVHMLNYDNAYWDGKQMTFGDGYNMFYPLTSLGVSAHEISHGFTQQHSNLQYYDQSGGMNEAFSDMAAQAAEVYAYGVGKNSWEIGPEIFKAEGEALRYMYQPSKDCKGGTPGDWCSIDDASQYVADMEVHHSSGVYNHFFYLLGTTEGWNAKKAFDVMVGANMNYWTANTTFSEGACGVISSANDLGYDVNAVKAAFDGVKVDYSAC